jgi:predicted  nucleic acid-binding Zn-ribbon protein
VDWSSDIPVIEELSPLPSEKIKILRIENQPTWVLSEALNCGIRFSGNPLILKLDADIVIKKNFFSYHQIPDINSFYAGNWKTAKDENEKHLSGSFFMHKDLFLTVNGYNEYIRFYGNDDNDLYDRLTSNGAKRLDLNTEYLKHIPHHENRNSKQDNSLFPDVSDHELSILKTYFNRTVSQAHRNWSNLENPFVKIEIHQESRYLFTGIPDSTTKTQPDDKLVKEAIQYAIKERVNDLLPHISRETIFAFPHKVTGKIYIILTDAAKNKNSALYKSLNTLLEQYIETINERQQWFEYMKSKHQETQNLLSLSEENNLNLNVEIKNIKQQNEILTGKRINLEKDVDIMKAEYEKLSDQYNEATEALNQTQETVAKQNTEILIINKKLNKTEEDLISQVNENKKLKSVYQETVSILKEEKTKNNNLENQNKHLETALQKTKNSLAERENSLKEIRATFWWRIYLKFCSKKRRELY